MKIDNSEIFTGDIYEAENYREKVIGNFGDCCFGDISYDKRIFIKNAILVKVGCMFVSVDDVSNVFKYLDVKSHVSGNSVNAPDRRFLSTIPSGWETQIVKNVKPFTTEKGKTDIKKLLKIHKENYEKTQQEKTTIIL